MMKGLNLGLTKLPSLKSLTLKLWPWEKLPKTLKHLKIVKGLDPSLKAEVSRLNIKSTDVFFCKYATDKQENLIVNILDDDSLIEISKYLSIEDSVSFAMTDARIYDLTKLPQVHGLQPQ